ncbi:MAG: hypothetical protein BVN34_04480 [Proteobacteria bacterium ST_bin12]|nr:MAG: hypothetical protein BVN34_04480 [Proteobacteria bacterium ST_bin12]
MKLRLLYITFLLSLAGCATPYAPPKLSENATLDFSSAKDITVYYFYLNGDDCTENQRLSEDLDPLKNETNTLTLAANKRVAFNFVWLTKGKWCQLPISFTPEVNGRYNLIAGLREDYCHLTILDKNNSNLSAANIDIKKMRYVNGWGIRNKCEPAD